MTAKFTTSYFNIYCVKSVQIRSFSGPYFPVFGLKTEIYGVNLRIQSEYRKVRTRKNSAFRHLLRSDHTSILTHLLHTPNGSFSSKKGYGIFHKKTS